jgi:uncharacterized membrane protein
MTPDQLKKLSLIERFSIRATKWVGSTESLFVHTVLFAAAFVLALWGVPLDKILLVLTTVVSLEAIYLSIFIQMSVNRQARRLSAVSRDIEEIQEDVEDIQEDVEEIQEDVEGIEKDVDEIQEDVEDIQENVEDIGEGVEDMTEDNAEEIRYRRIEETLQLLSKEISELPRPGAGQKK